MIRRLFYTLLLFSFMLSHAEWSQWVRIPILVHHFFEHQTSQSSPVTWIEFMELHYGKSIDHPDDIHGDHGKLPFLSYHAPSIFVPLVSALPILYLPWTSPVDEELVFSDFQPALLIQDISTIWHPPIERS